GRGRVGGSPNPTQAKGEVVGNHAHRSLHAFRNCTAVPPSYSPPCVLSRKSKPPTCSFRGSLLLQTQGGRFGLRSKQGPETEPFRCLNALLTTQGKHSGISSQGWISIKGGGLPVAPAMAPANGTSHVLMRL